MIRPNWWPPSRGGGEIGLLDVRETLCRLNGFGAAAGKAVRFCEPAILCKGLDGSVVSWGEPAALWEGRRSEEQICRLFPNGWPLDTELARWYLKKLHESHLGKRESYRVFLVETAERAWARQLWQETLEDTGFSLQGFLLPWQHDLLWDQADDATAAMSPHLHFCLQPSHLRWRLIRAGESVADGQHPGFSRGRLLSQITSFMRQHRSVELADDEVLRALVGSAPPDGSVTYDDLSLPMAGRQLVSGLPTRQTFVWSDFLATAPSLLYAWQEVRSAIFAAAELRMEGREGLDLPGWRVLTPNRLARLFVDGPVVRLWDGSL